MSKLTAKQTAFIDSFVGNGGTNGTAAAREAGYAVPEVAAARLLSTDKIKAAVQERMGKAIARLERKRDFSVDRVLEALHDLAFYDLDDIVNPDGSVKPVHDMPPAARRVIAGLEVSDSKDGGKLKKVKLSDRRAALDMLMRYHSLYKDKVEVSGGVTFVRSSIPRPERL